MPEGIILAFDFGLRRIGVAVGAIALGRGRPLTTISAQTAQARFLIISELIDEWRPSGLVVGLPRSLDGSDHAMTKRCRRFANQLRGRFGLPVDLVDERLTSVTADIVIRDRGHEPKARGASRDSVAATLILQDYFHAATACRSAL